MSKHPSTTPLAEWPSGWLKLEVARRLDHPAYLTMSDGWKRAIGWPVTDEEMRQYIQLSRVAEEVTQEVLAGERPSIECPHCGRVSYNPTDIRELFCSACGFHDGRSK